MPRINLVIQSGEEVIDELFSIYSSIRAKLLNSPGEHESDLLWLEVDRIDDSNLDLKAASKSDVISVIDEGPIEEVSRRYPDVSVITYYCSDDIDLQFSENKDFAQEYINGEATRIKKLLVNSPENLNT